ncbi:MAG TPA: protease HtpX [Vicinamibacteria bacterium]
MAKRIVLFILTNIAVMVMVSLVMAVLGQLGLLNFAGNQSGLIVLCLVWGMGASIVSLLMSRQIAKWSLGVKLVDGNTGNPDLDWLHNKIGQLAQQANLPMPQVGYYDSPEVNAFATGPSRKRSLVAVSTGLLRGMGKQEVEAVLGHEISHVANGDMVTMTLIQGVVNAFVLYLSHIVALIVRNAMSRDDERGPSMMGYLASQIVFIAAQIAFGLLGSMITAWFSRQREFRADAGGATLAGRGSMIAALRRLETFSGRVDNQRAPALATLKISGAKKAMMLLATHPPLELRIAALEGRA